MGIRIQIACEDATCTSIICGTSLPADASTDSVIEQARAARWFDRNEKEWYCPNHPPAPEPEEGEGGVMECWAYCIHAKWSETHGEDRLTCRLTDSRTAADTPCRPWVLKLLEERRARDEPAR